MRPIEMARLARIRGCGLVAVLAISAPLFACSDPPQHVYAAMPYVSELKCLGPYESIDLINADHGGGAKCATVCLASGSDAFVSTECGPYPEGYDTSGTSAACTEALAAPGCDEAAETACEAVCDLRAAGTGCVAGDVAATCKAACAESIPALEPDCQTKALAFFLCGAKATWSCPASGAAASPDGGACGLERRAYEGCAG